MIVAVGFLAGRTHALSESAAQALITVTFRLALPALVFVSVARAPLHQTLSASLAISAAATMAVFVVYVAVARWACGQRRGDAVIGAWSATYSNAGYLGVPLAAYVFHDVTPAISVVLFQMTILMPIGLAIIESDTSDRGMAATAALFVVRSPIVVAAVGGVVIAATGVHVPDVVATPMTRISEIAVPAVLLAFGAMFHHTPATGLRESGASLLIVCMLKVLVVPGLIFVLAHYVAGMALPAVIEVTLIAAMPTAVNVYAVAASYGQGESLARASSIATTILSIPIVVFLALGWH